MWTCHGTDDTLPLKLCQLPLQMVSTMNWNDPAKVLPALAQRVLVETKEGSHLFAKRVYDITTGGTRWIDDQSCPILSPVERWAMIVSPNEIDA